MKLMNKINIIKEILSYIDRYHGKILPIGDDATKIKIMNELLENEVIKEGEITVTPILADSAEKVIVEECKEYHIDKERAWQLYEIRI